MPISSSRLRLTSGSPFTGPSSGNHRSSSPRVTASTPKVIAAIKGKPSCSHTQLPGDGARTGTRSAHIQGHQHQTRMRKFGNYVMDKPVASHAGLPMLARVQARPTKGQQLHMNLSDSAATPRHTTAHRGRAPGHPVRVRQHHAQGESPTRLGGMPRDQFALKKIRFFSSPPQPAPLTLCFPYPGYDLTHREILAGVKKRGAIDVKRVRNIQFVDMNVLLGAAGVLNRWLITLTDHDARYRLFNDGLYIRGERLCLRRYDDVNYEDYRDYLRRKNTLQSDAHTAVQRLLSL